eukprot:TRINITY_DN17_c0_g1_i1.p1 TRINITY_DN17_c0_g1~~TRINITY_DN17_c0_g1_i1.p1  ORF type:complete len:331 (+),score=86.47 TRINITY_DN17_c0_g1_i1:247-1239(+)
MKSFFGLILLAIALCDAHTLLTNVTINGRTTNECLRPATGDSSPIMASTGDRNGIMEANYTCGFLPHAARAAKASCPIAAGSLMNISYYHGAGYGDETPEKDFWIASSHRGPFLAYMTRWENSTGIPSGLAWFKIFHSGITKNATGDYKTIQWASPDTLNSNNGAMTVRIPPQLAPGRYLLRTEIIALHDSQERGAQPYIRCIDLTVTGTGTVIPKDLVALPGAVGYNHPGLRFNVYQTKNQVYPIPGPAVFDFTKASTQSGNGTIPDISCAGYPSGACPAPARCNMGTGRCECPEGFGVEGFQCIEGLVSSATSFTIFSGMLAILFFAL